MARYVFSLFYENKRGTSADFRFLTPVAAVSALRHVRQNFPDFF
jgi:hypothetical protein